MNQAVIEQDGMSRNTPANPTPDSLTGLLLPLSDRTLLLPNVAVAELIAYRNPQVAAGLPQWYLGQVAWRDLRLPLAKVRRTVRIAVATKTDLVTPEQLGEYVETTPPPPGATAAAGPGPAGRSRITRDEQRAWQRGVGLLAGNALGGRAAQVSVPRTLVVTLGMLAVVMTGFALTASSQVLTIVALVLMGGFGFATVPPLQMRVMSHAGQARTLASGANIAAFNVGNAIGAWIGGTTIAAGLGYTSPIWVGAGMAAPREQVARSRTMWRPRQNMSS